MKGDVQMNNLKDTGLVRTVDELGRIILPKEVRSQMNIGSTEELSIFINEDSIAIVLKKVHEDNHTKMRVLVQKSVPN
jgi:AbrB family looped-hinge helix DNA binding protein